MKPTTNILGRWMMLLHADTYTNLTFCIEEFTEQQCRVYNRMELQNSYSITIDHEIQRVQVNDSIYFNYTIRDGLLYKTYPQTETQQFFESIHIPLKPTLLTTTVEEVLTKRFQLTYTMQGEQRQELLDFTNPDPRSPNQLTIEPIEDTYFIVSYFNGGVAMVLPIIELHSDHLMIYGFQGKVTQLTEVPREDAAQPDVADLATQEQLSIVMDSLREQKENLKQQINTATADWQFDTAHYLADAYEEVNKQFNTIALLQNKYHQDILQTERMLSYYKKQLEKDVEDYRRKSLLDSIKSNELTLQRLKTEAPPLRKPSKEIEHAVVQLQANELKGIKVILKAKHDISIQITKPDSAFVIILTIDTQNPYVECNFTKLKSLGFTEGEKVFMHSNCTSVESVVNVLSRVTFEAFPYQTLDKPVQMMVY